MSNININICSLNCRGLGEWHKRHFLSDLFKINSVDICFLQETHCYSKFIANSWEKQWGGKCYWSFGNNRSRGVCIWFREGLNYKILKQCRDSEGRIISLLILFNNQCIKLTNVYAPVKPKERKLFFSSFSYYLKGKHHNILGGDFNCVISNNLDKQGGNYSYGEFGSENLQSICNDFNLVDSFRHQNKNKKEYTWRNSLGNIFIRLDRMYVTKVLQKDVTQVSHLHIIDKVSDHDMVKLTLNLNANDDKETGPGYWKCNINTLKDPIFQQNFLMIWERLEKIENQNSTWWEDCKLMFKKLIISHSLRLSMIRKDKQKDARHKLDKLLRDNTADNRNEIILAQNEIEKLLEESLEGSKIRSKVQYLENNEKPTRFFLQREKQLAENKCIHELKKSDGTIVNTNQDIKEECVSFYTKLYKTEEIDTSLQRSFFADMPKLSEESALQCEGQITLEECEQAIKKMANFKTPGSDGLPKEFYEFAFKYIGRSYVNFLNRCLDEGMLPPSLRQGLITLICKDPLNADTLKNWRPISLLNTDYKILSKVLTIRLTKVIKEIVHPDQTCSIPDRTIQDNVHLIRNLVEYTNDKNMPAAIISIDQSKAFDRVSHDYLFSVLSNLGFKPTFISLIKLLYTEINSSILVNGFISEQFPVERSVRQGCCLSPLLYVITMEPLAHRIRTNPMIKGIPLPGTAETAKICQYADDTNLFISDTKSVKYILELVELYGKMTGAVLNLDKTFGIWLGRWRGRTDEPCGIKWTTECQKFYGIYIGGKEAIQKTWDNVIKKLEKCILLYSRRDLSFKGRSVILQAVLCTSIWYVGSLIAMPQRVEQKLNKLIFTFLWNKQPEALKRETLYNTFLNGGLNIIDIKTKLASFRVIQVLQIIKGQGAKWKHLAVYWLGLHLRNYVRAFASLSIPHADKMPEYYKHAMKVFSEFTTLVPDFMGRQSVTTKFIYAQLLDSRLVPPRVIKIYPTINLSQSWKWIHCDFVDPRYRDLAWRITHQILPTQCLLYKYHISRNTKCYLCKRSVETISHLFYECPILKDLWAFVETILSLLTGCQVKISLNAIRFNMFTPHALSSYNKLLILLINTMKYCIWSVRNMAKHEFKQATTLSIKSMFIRTLSLRIKADFKRLDRDTFSEYWCRDNAVAYIDGDAVKILLRLHLP